MSRIAAIDPAHATAAVKPMLDAVNANFGVTPNLFRVAAQSPAALEGLLGLNGALVKGALDARTRGAIALAVSEANASNYCLSAHSALGVGAGLSDQEMSAARSGRSNDPKTAAILRFAHALVQNRGQTSDGDLAQLRQAGVNEGEVVEVVANVVLHIFTNYLNSVAGTEIDFPVVQAGMAKAA